MDSPLDLTGLGLEASAFAAAIKGWSAQASWTRPFGIFPDGVASGPAFGYGAGISGMVTYTWYRGEYDLNNLPSDILKILEPYLPQLSDGCD